MTSRIRVDNLQNIAILEYRSSEGAVVRQFPTEAQIQAFKRAAQIAAEHRSQSTGFGNQGSGEGHTSSAPAPSSSPAPQPSTADIVAATVSTYTPTGGSGSGTGGSTQSVEV